MPDTNLENQLPEEWTLEVHETVQKWIALHASLLIDQLTEQRTHNNL